MSDIINKLLKETPLEARIKVANEMAFIELITELGYRENKMWGDDEDKILNKLCDLAQKHTVHILEHIEEWEKDGKPL